MKVPYTYLIGWSDKNLWYYGCNHQKDCNPTDLFVSYFTNNKHIHQSIMKYGLPDVVTVRRIFKSARLALLWHQKVMRRMNDIWIENIELPKKNLRAVHKDGKHIMVIEDLLQNYLDSGYKIGMIRPDRFGDNNPMKDEKSIQSHKEAMDKIRYKVYDGKRLFRSIQDAAKWHNIPESKVVYRCGKRAKKEKWSYVNNSSTLIMTDFTEVD